MANISLRPPESVALAAEKGLEFRQKFNRGGTEIGLNRAKELKARHELDPHTVLRMASYFARHEVDKKTKDFGNEEKPSNGYIAWLLWGGESGKEWSYKLKEQLKPQKVKNDGKR